MWHRTHAATLLVMHTTTPADAATEITERPVLPPGDGERYTGFAVLGVPFASGDVLALRLIGALSVAPGYRSVWHRSPDGIWRFITTTAAHLSCPRYFGAEPGATHLQRDVRVRWPDPWRLEVSVPGLLEWSVTLEETAATRTMSAVAGRLPEAAWTAPSVLAPMGRVAGPYLGVGRSRLHGTVPNGQRFTAAPTRVWAVTESSAVVDSRYLGDPTPLTEQTWLGDFPLPQRGLAAAAHGAFEDFDPSRHAPAEHLGVSA